MLPLLAAACCSRGTRSHYISPHCPCLSPAPQIQKTRGVSVFPVGLVTELGVSSPVVLGGRVTGFYDGWPGGRMFPMDMAGFAVSVTLLQQVRTGRGGAVTLLQQVMTGRGGAVTLLQQVRTGRGGAVTLLQQVRTARGGAVTVGSRWVKVGLRWGDSRGKTKLLPRVRFSVHDRAPTANREYFGEYFMPSGRGGYLAQSQSAACRSTITRQWSIQAFSPTHTRLPLCARPQLHNHRAQHLKTRSDTCVTTTFLLA